MRPSELYNGYSRAGKTKSLQDFTGTISLLLRKDMAIYCNIQENNKRIKSYKVFFCQKPVSQAWISNCMPQNTVGCNYLSHEIPASLKTSAIHHAGKIEMFVQIPLQHC